MKLTWKLSLAIGLGICLVLAANAYVRLRTDSAAYRDDVRRDHDTTGRSLATAVELLWRTDGETRAREVVEELNLRTSHATIRWVWRAATPGEPEAPQRPDLVPALGPGTRSEIVERDDGAPRMLSYTRVDLPGDRDGAIEIDESLADEREHVRATLVRTATTTGVLIVLCVGLTLAFGTLFVARPLRRLAEKARRIGEGDLSAPLDIEQDDEIRDVARAMNDMCDRLGEARTRIERETGAKMRALEQLRHADRLRTVGQLASTIAHELGTPLNVVRARAAMVADGSVSEARVRELGGVIVVQCDRMTGIIRGLLDYARRDPPDRFESDLVRAVRESVQWLQDVARERKVAIELDAEASELFAWIDPRQIQQAVTNLVLNAVQASPAGATVTVRVRAERVDRDGEAIVEVNDHGPGIAPEHRDRLFEPFFTTKGTGEGTGLGLPIVDGIVREHGGSIEVTSMPGDGACFRIRLPLQSAGAIPEPREPPRGSARPGSWRGSSRP
ncbi:sensor histidine kinase [Sandaracinus amylolyticus]|uniref:histidine kinase n=1 Tax=Sandaracinus amylolyticus TaxID=927083 RepID=A0A0F6W1D5_9BACT|nr:HAMP domain-containing sensor histidine kinase [Sandaracinus amylolyticus]AKF05006.1 periplasmic sensor signal transduction histidine kinase [Sandaracinus amylolyticus]